MSGCKRTCLHRQRVEDYQAARIAAEMAREDATRGWATETREYGPILDFKTWLKQTATRRDADRVEPAGERRMTDDPHPGSGGTPPGVATDRINYGSHTMWRVHVTHPSLPDVWRDSGVTLDA